MKKIEWINDNKMLFESLHKTFNKQCKLISTGNQIGDVVLSSFIRPYNETKCNYREFPKGHLRHYDLNNLVSDLPLYVKDWIIKNTIDKGVYAYHFFYYVKGKRKDIGYVVTTGGPGYEHLRHWYVGTYKAESALREARKYITN